MKRVIFAFFTLLILYPAANAQLWKQKRYEVYGGLGTSQFFADIGGYTPGENAIGFKDIIFSQTRFNAMAGMRYRIYEPFSVKVSFTYGMLHASDETGSNVGRGYESKSSVFEPSATAEYYFVKNKVEGLYRFSKGRNVFSSIFSKIDAYVFAGVAPVFYNVKPNEALSSVIEKDGGVAVAFPVGLGLNYILSPNTNIGIDLGLRYTTTDYLDGYTSQFSNSNDVYYFMTFVFTYKLKTSRNGLPSFRN
jgi:hypothetical protein